jgi:copper chaperone CopZ
MKLQNIIAIVFIAVFTLTACKTETKKTPEVKKEIKVDNPQKLAFNISGMTCEIGCAKTIQSKLSKKAGITSAKVIFKDSLGLVEFDGNSISKEDITAFINGIAGGDMYKVNNAKTVSSFDEVTK